MWEEGEHVDEPCHASIGPLLRRQTLLGSHGTYHVFPWNPRQLRAADPSPACQREVVPAAPVLEGCVRVDQRDLDVRVHLSRALQSEGLKQTSLFTYLISHAWLKARSKRAGHHLVFWIYYSKQGFSVSTKRVSASLLDDDWSSLETTGLCIYYYSIGNFWLERPVLLQLSWSCGSLCISFLQKGAYDAAPALNRDATTGCATRLHYAKLEPRTS